MKLLTYKYPRTQNTVLLALALLLTALALASSASPAALIAFGAIVILLTVGGIIYALLYR